MKEQLKKLLFFDILVFMEVPDLTNRYIRRKTYLKAHYKEFYDFIEANYEFCDSFSEKLYCYANHLTAKHKCLVCGNYTYFMNYNKGYLDYCCQKCAHNEETIGRQKISISAAFKNRKNEILKLREETCLKRYGVINGGSSKQSLEKYKDTCLKRYGAEYYSQSQQHNQIKDYINSKTYITKRRNHSFNTSKIEKLFEQYLKDNNIEYKTQYKSKLYPFRCDFYLPAKDLYIEIQGSWTHGGRPYIGTDDDLKQLKVWQSKNTKYYNNAIKTWTIRDVQKRDTAKKNQLNYLEIFSCDIDEAIKIFITY